MPTRVAESQSSSQPPGEPEQGSSATPARRPEIDSLRIGAMMLVLVIHAAEPFNPWDAWHVQSPERSKWLGELVLLLAPWVMPLFMLLAGASAWYSLGKRSTGEYLNERVTRVLVPLTAGVLLLVPPQMYMDRRQHGLFDGTLLEFYPRFFDGLYPTGNFGWLHLWFLGILALFALITLPLFRWLRGPAGRRASSWLARICTPPGAIFLLALPVLAFRAALWTIWPDSRPIVTDWSNRTTLLPLFIYGYLLAGEPRLLRAVDRQWKLALAVALAFSAAMFGWAWPGDVTERFPAPFSGEFLFLWSAYTLGGWAWPVAALGATRAAHAAHAARTARVTHVRAGGPIERTRWLLTPFYMLHQPVIVVLGFYLVRATIGPVATFLVLLVSAFSLTIALCVLARRWRVTRAILGIRAPAVAPLGPPATVPPKSRIVEKYG